MECKIYDKEVSGINQFVSVRFVCEECLFVQQEMERVACDGNVFRYTRKAGLLCC